MINPYNKFFNERLEYKMVVENVQQAKRWLASKEIPETNKDYVKIREMLSKNPGWTYVFVKFFFDEKVPMEELANTYENLKEYGNLLSTLPQTIDKYDGRKVTVDGKEITLNYEKLTDDIQEIQRQRKLKSLFNEFPKQLKAEFARAPKELLQKLEDVSAAFSDLPAESQKAFIAKISRYKTLHQLLRNLESYIKGSSSANIESLLDKIDEVNQYLNKWLKAEVVYLDEKNEIAVVDVRTWESIKKLAPNTSWCIVSSAHHWQSYVGGDNTFRKQYIIYNYGLGTQDLSIIGVTVGENGSVSHAHTKSDRSFVSDLKGYCSKYGIPFTSLKGMSKDEIDRKKKFIIANNEIKKKQKDIENVKRLIADGADVNTDAGRPIKNALEDGNLELVKFLVQNGADINIDPNIIKDASNFKTLKFLIENGADISTQDYIALKNMAKANDDEGVKYLVDQGADVNVESAYPIRWAFRWNNKDVTKFLLDRKGDPYTKNGIALKWASEYSNLEFIKWLVEDIGIKFNKSNDWSEQNQDTKVSEYLKTKVKS